MSQPPGDLETRAWREAALMVLHGRVRDEDLTYALGAWRTHLRPGHPVLVLLEACRSYVRGERSALTAEELEPLYRAVQSAAGIAT